MSRESAPCNATDEAIVVVESLIGDILTEVQNGLGYADARAKSNRIFFDAFIKGQTNGYSYGELVDIANAAIWQYRDMYQRPDFCKDNLKKVELSSLPLLKIINPVKSPMQKQILMHGIESINPSSLTLILMLNM